MYKAFSVKYDTSGSVTSRCDIHMFPRHPGGVQPSTPVGDYEVAPYWPTIVKYL